MYKLNSIKYNFVMNLILTVSNFLFPLITFPYVSRILLPEGMGKVAFATSIITYFTMFAVFGVNSYGIRAVAECRDNKEKLSKITQEIVLINLILTLFSYIILYFLLQTEQLNNEKELFLVSALSILFTVLNIEWFYKGIEQYKFITVRSIVFKFIGLISIFFFVKEKNDYVIFVAISSLIILGSAIVNLFYIRHFIYLKPLRKYNIINHVKPMVLFFLMSLAIAVYTNFDSTLLGLLQTNEDVGYYSAAIKIKFILLAVVTSLGAVLLPRLSYYISNSMENEFHKALNKSVNFILLISLPITIFIILHSNLIITILAGENYYQSTILLQIISITIILVGLTNILGIQMLIPLKREGALLFSVICGAIINITLNLWLIPTLSSLGAAISLVIAELLILMIQIYLLKDYIKILFTRIEYSKILLAVSLAYLTNILLQYVIQRTNMPFINLSIYGILFFMIYIAILFLLKEKLTYTLIKQLMIKI